MKSSPNNFLYAHSFYSVDEFFACTDIYYWLIWLRKFLHCNKFMCLVCFWMFFIYSTSCCLATASGIYGMYVYVYILTYTINNLSCRFIKTAACSHPLLKFWCLNIELLIKIFWHLHQTLQTILNKPRQYPAQLTAFSFLYNKKICCSKTHLKKVIRT